MSFSPPTYSYACPKCGDELTPVASGPYTTPWLCTPDGLGFWSSELTDDARAIYDIPTNSWGTGPDGQAIMANVQDELNDAVSRGTSLREDQIGIATTSMLESVENIPNVDPDFLALVEEQLANT